MDLAYMAALPQEEFTERRQKVFAQMQPNSALLLFSEIEKRRNNDCDFPFRQDSYFWYLTGFNGRCRKGNDISSSARSFA